MLSQNNNTELGEYIFLALVQDADKCLSVQSLEIVFWESNVYCLYLRANVVDPFEVEEDAWAEDSLGTVKSPPPFTLLTTSLHISLRTVHISSVQFCGRKKPLNQNRLLRLRQAAFTTTATSTINKINFLFFFELPLVGLKI